MQEFTPTPVESIKVGAMFRIKGDSGYRLATMESTEQQGGQTSFSYYDPHHGSQSRTKPNGTVYEVLSMGEEDYSLTDEDCEKFLSSLAPVMVGAPSAPAESQGVTE